MNLGFSQEEVLFAREVLNKLYCKEIPWECPAEYESAYFVNTEFSWWDISKEKHFNTVVINWDMLKALKSTHNKYITIHNHPRGTLLPSRDDWAYSRSLEEIYPSPMFNMIIEPSFLRAVLFAYGKGFQIINLTTCQKTKAGL